MYNIMEVIGKGGFATFYKLVPVDETECAVKVLKVCTNCATSILTG